MTATVTRKRSRPGPVRRARKPDLSVLVVRWAGRQVWRGCRWCAVQGGRRTKGVSVRSAQRVAAPVRRWSGDRARFGSGGAVACGGCGARIRMDRQGEHSCVADAAPPELQRLSGEQIRADEPIQATAVRLDQAHPDQPFATRESWAATPRLAEMTDKEFRAHAAELRETLRARRDEQIEADLWRRAGVATPPDVDEHGRITEPATTNTAVVTPIRKDVATMTEPKDWANSADVFAEHGIGNTDELIAFLEQAAQGGSTLVQHVQTFAEAMDAANVDDDVVGSLGEAAEAADMLMKHLSAAHQKALGAYSEVTMPDFSKAS